MLVADRSQRKLAPPLEDKIREAGQEYGTTTGRARRIGWIDLVQLKHANQLNGFTELVLTKVDVLSGLARSEAVYRI